MHAHTLVRRSLGVAASLVLVAGVIGFGVAQGAVTGTARGTVYRDANNNGRRDAGEVGVAGVVVQTPRAATVTNAAGQWTLKITGKERVEVLTGWYRSQCNALTCAAGPGRDQDFRVDYQSIVAVADAAKKPRLDVGLLPDWPGGYPISSKRPIPANSVDVSVRTSFDKPTGAAGSSNCYRTKNPANRACAIGDRPTFTVRIYNEGTKAVASLAGHVQLPPGTTLVGVSPSTTPRNHPSAGAVTFGSLDAATRRVPFRISGSLPPAALAAYVVTLRIDANAPLTTSLQTKGSYPNPFGARITSVSGDAEGDLCVSNSATCRWGTTDRQATPDNSDTVGFAIVAPPAGTAATTTTTSTTAAPTTTRPPTTTQPVTTTTTTPRATTTTTTTTTTQPPSTTKPPTTTLPPSTQNPGNCSVSAILVPSCGAWFGASTASLDGTYDYTRGLAEYEAVAQNTPDILHFYKVGAQTFPTAKEVAMAQRPGTQRSLLFYNWKPSRTATWRQIADGAADADIAMVAANLGKYPKKLFLTIYHEPEDNVNAAAGSGMTPADYADMYRHVVDELRAAGVTNVVYVWNVMGYYGWRDYLDALYPGHDYVDWIAYDPYGWSIKQTTVHSIVQDAQPNLGWPGFYAWATAKAPGKPLMLGEWGFDLASYSNPAANLTGAADALRIHFPMIKAVVYWHDVVNGKVNPRIDTALAASTGYDTAYRQLAASSYFNAITPDAAP